MVAKSIAQKRKEFMTYLTSVMDLLDPTGDNSKIYHEKYDKMSDQEFDRHIREFFNDDNAQFYLEIIEFERVFTMKDLENCAKFMKVPLYERVALPYNSEDPNVVTVTPTPVPVGYIHEKRMPQTLLKKSAGSIEIESRSSLTGQVTGHDKNARNTDTETYSLIALGADNALKEFMGPRADDTKAKAEMYKSISKDGYVSLQDLDNDPYNKVALNTLDVYFAMQGISTNLITDLGEINGPRGNDKVK